MSPIQQLKAIATNSPADLQDARLGIAGKRTCRGCHRPLSSPIGPAAQSEGQALAAKLKQAGVTVDAHNYDGVTHEFFGMGFVTGKAKQTEDVAVKNLKEAFARGS